MKPPRASWMSTLARLIGVAALVTVTIVLVQMLSSTSRLQPPPAATARSTLVTLPATLQVALPPTSYPSDWLAKKLTAEATLVRRENYPGPPYPSTVAAYPLSGGLSSPPPTPVVAWSVQPTPVLLGPWGLVNQPGWTSASATSASGNPPQPPYEIRCEDSLRLYRSSDNHIMSEAPVKLGCPNATWAGNESAAALVTDKNEVYIWRADGSAPFKVANNLPFTYVAWSPNSDRLIISASTTGQTGTPLVVDTDGKTVTRFEIATTADEGWARLTENVLDRGGPHEQRFYDITTGRLLVDWLNWPEAQGVFNQPPRLSPNQRWMTLDQGGLVQSSNGHSYIQRHYGVYDLQDEVTYTLAESSGNYLDFSGWSADSSTLYLISRPIDSAAVSDPHTPFGLIAYDPLTQQFRILFRYALQMQWNQARSLAWLVFPVRRADGTVGLDSGIFNLATGTLVAQQYVSDRVIYPGQLPAERPAVAWSQAGTRLVFDNLRDQVILQDATGSTLMLAAGLPEGDTHFTWSPDDRQLLIEYQNQAWILAIPTS